MYCEFAELTAKGLFRISSYKVTALGDVGALRTCGKGGVRSINGQGDIVGLAGKMGLKYNELHYDGVNENGSVTSTSEGG